MAEHPQTLGSSSGPGMWEGTKSNQGPDEEEAASQGSCLTHL